MSEKGGSFWSSTAAMITGIGTLLAALVALATFLVGPQLFGNGTSGPEEPDGPPVTDAAGKKLDEKVQSGPEKLLLAHLDLDPEDGPLRNPDSFRLVTDVYLWSEGTISASYGMVKWEGSKAPGQNDCAKRLRTHGTGEHLPFDEGDRFCILTDEGRVALMVVLGKTSTGREVEVTVWKQRLTTQ